jgi:putative ABC transport system permease protein
MWIFKLALRVALFTVTSAFSVGIFENIYADSTALIGHVRVVDPDFLEREQLNPLYEYVPAAEAVAADIERRVPGAHAYPIIKSGMAVSVDDTIGDVFAITTGSTDAWMRERGTLEDKLINGEWPDWNDGQMLVGQRIAEMAGLEVGSEIVLFGQTQDGAISPVGGTVAGIVYAGNPLVDKQVFMSLATLQYAADIDDGALEVLVYGDDLDDAEALADQISTLASVSGLVVEPWTQRSPFDSLVGITAAMQAIIGLILVFITALAIWNTMTMSVLERTSEIGVMRAMGMGRGSAVLMFVVEAVVIAIIGGVIGMALGALLSWPLIHWGYNMGTEVLDNIDAGEMAMSAHLYAKLTPDMLIKGFFVGIAMAIAGSFIPSLRAASIRPVDAMKGGR